ncbi:MAG: tetratricopeptide repeat protein, partial [Bacilli bacterium]
QAETRAGCLYLIANNYAHLGNFFQAKKFAVRYVEEHPNGQFIEDAEDLLNFITEEYGKEFDEEQEMLIDLQEQANELLEAGDSEGAIEVLESIVAQYPENWGAYNTIALGYFQQMRVKEAFELCDWVLQKNPGNIFTLCNLLVFYHTIRAKKDVAELIGILKDVVPTSLEPTYKLASTFAVVGAYNEALRLFKRIQRYHSVRDERFFYLYSMCAHRLGYDALAEQIYTQGLREGVMDGIAKPWDMDPIAGRAPMDARLLEVVAAATTNDRLILDEVQMRNNDAYHADVFYRAMMDCALQDDPRAFRRVSLNSATVQIFECAMKLFLIVCENERMTRQLFTFVYPILERWYASGQTYSANGMCGAILYLFYRGTEWEVGQREVAEQVEISVGTISKYCKVVKSLSR